MSEAHLPLNLFPALEPMPYSDLSSLIALGGSPKSKWVDLDTFKTWLVSERAKRLAPFVYDPEKAHELPPQLEGDFRTIIALSGVPALGSN